MNAPTKVSLHAEAAVVKLMIVDFTIHMKNGDVDAARETAEKASRMVRGRPILAGIANGQADFLLDTLNGSLGNEAKVGLANLMLRLHYASAGAIRGRLEDKKIFPVRPERTTPQRAERANLRWVY
ncbi:MAG: hypothetical protein WC350_04460 [Candidatus Micrarchaeia archaeon]|jgi:hypothetical protein